MTTPVHTAIWQKTLTFTQLYEYIFSLVYLIQGHSAERLEGDLFVPACAMSPAAGSGDGVEMSDRCTPADKPHLTTNNGTYNSRCDTTGQTPSILNKYLLRFNKIVTVCL